MNGKSACRAHHSPALPAKVTGYQKHCIECKKHRFTVAYVHMAYSEAETKTHHDESGCFIQPDTDWIHP